MTTFVTTECVKELTKVKKCLIERFGFVPMWLLVIGTLRSMVHLIFERNDGI